jgi:hypothetical protein
VGWLAVIANRAGTEVGEVHQATSRTVTPRPWRSVPTSGLQLRSDNWLVPYAELGEVMRLKWYDPAGTLRFNGPLVPSIEKVADDTGATVAVTAAGGAILLGDRLLGKDRNGFVVGSALAPVDRTEIARQVLGAANASEATGIVEGTILACGGLTAAGPWFLKPGLDAVAELASALDGFDWEVEPLEPAANAGAIGRLNMQASFGQLRPNAIWEFGMGKDNVKSWRYAIQTDQVANSLWNAPSGWPDNATQNIVNATDPISIAQRGLKEAVVQQDLAVDAFRLQLLQEHVAVRAQPRKVITFEPMPDAAASLVYGVDYREGDLITFRAVERYPIYDSSGVVVIGYQEVDEVDILCRLYAVTYTIDEQGLATPAFTVIEQ